MARYLDYQIKYFTTAEVMLAAIRIKPNNAPGPDYTPPEIIQTVLERK